MNEGKKNLKTTIPKHDYASAREETKLGLSSKQNVIMPPSKSDTLSCSDVKTG